LAEVFRTLKLLPYNSSYYKLALPTFLTGAVLASLHALARNPDSSWVIAIVALLCAYVTFAGTLLIFGLADEDRRVAAMAWNKIGRYFHPVAEES
jgi:hypothetical protein